MKQSLIVLAMGLGIMLAAGSAAADVSPPDRTTARQLAVEGQIALKKGDFDTAADRFSRANELVPAPSFLVRLARARTGQGRLVEAYELYKKVIRDGVAPDQHEAFHLALADAKEEVETVEVRLAWVSVTVVGASPEVAQVSLNATPVPSAALGAQRPVDPGKVRAVASAEGYRTATFEFEVMEGERRPAIELRLVKIPPPPPPVRPDPSDLMVDQDPPLIAQSTLGYVALVGGGLALAGGGVAGVVAMRRHRDLVNIPCNSLVDGVCNVIDPDGSAEARAQDLLEDRDRFATLATIGLIAGGATAAVGMVLLLTAPDDPEESSGPSLQPYAGFGSVGVLGRF